MAGSAKDYRTPAARVRGLGASGHGAAHFITQRVSAMALFVLLPIWLFMIAGSGAPAPDASLAFLSSPAGAVVTLLTLTASFYHMRLGLQVVIEDYITKSGTKTVLLIANTLLVAGLWLAAVFFLLTLAL